MRNASLIAALALTACAPQSAELTSGSYTAFIAEATSVSLARGEIDLEGYDNYHQIDCRYFEDADIAEALRLEDRLPICGANDDGEEDHFTNVSNPDLYDVPDIENYDDDLDGVFDWLDCDDNDDSVGADGCEPGEGDGFWPPLDHYWLAADGFHIVTEDLDPWRGEAVVTHEGDLLITFHHRLPGDSDFWFQFALDRHFQPTECLEDDNGEVVRAAYDGDWIDEWSKDLEAIAELRDDEEAFAPYAHLDSYLDGGRLFYLNGRLVQYNPDTGDDGVNNEEWFMPEQWSSGAAQGKFSEELLVDATPVTANPQLLALIAQGYYAYQFTDLASLLWYCEMLPGAEPTEDACMMALDVETNERVRGSTNDLNYVLAPDEDSDPVNTFAPMRHMNYWRAVDGRPSGFDGWAEMYHSYVVFSEDSDLRIGGSARGAFTMVMGAVDSNSYVLVKGEFEIPKIKKDRWAPDNLREEKREEAQENSDGEILYCSKP